MEPLGFRGIIKLTTQIIHRNLKHFLCIAFILALPYAFLLAVTPSSRSIYISQNAHDIISLMHKYAHYGKIPSPPVDTPIHPQLPYPLLIVILLVPVLVRLLTLPVLTFSVCRAVLNKSLACRSSLLAVPRSALNLIFTVLCVAGVLFGLSTAMVILMIIMVAGLLAIHINPVTVVVIWSLVMVGGWLYLSVVWSLANTVAILEERRGWEAIRRSMYLVEGNKWVALRLAVFFGGCIIIAQNIITPFEEASVVWRWSCVVVSVGLQAMIALLSMASTVVLYLSCKSRFNEPLDTLIALSSQFGPEEPPAKYMDLESARFDIA